MYYPALSALAVQFCTIIDTFIPDEQEVCTYLWFKLSTVQVIHTLQNKKSKSANKVSSFQWFCMQVYI